MFFSFVTCILVPFSSAHQNSGRQSNGVCYAPQTNINSICKLTSDNMAYPSEENDSVECFCTVDGNHSNGSMIYPTGELYINRSCSSDGTWSGVSPICVTNLKKIVERSLFIRSDKPTGEFVTIDQRRRDSFKRMNFTTRVLNIEIQLKMPASIFMVQLMLNWRFDPKEVSTNHFRNYSYDFAWNKNRSIPEFVVKNHNSPKSDKEFNQFNLEIYLYEAINVWPIYGVQVYNYQGENMNKEGFIQSIEYKVTVETLIFKYASSIGEINGGEKLSKSTDWIGINIKLSKSTQLHSIVLDLDQPFDVNLKHSSTEHEPSFYVFPKTKKEVNILVSLPYQDPVHANSTVNVGLEFGTVRKHWPLINLDVFGYYDDVEDCWYPEKNEYSQVDVIRDNTTGRMKRANYTCPEGYKLRGNSSRICRSGGHWSDHPPTCFNDTSYNEANVSLFTEYIMIGAGSIAVPLLAILVLALVILKRRRSGDAGRHLNSPPEARSDLRQTEDDEEQYCYADNVREAPRDRSIALYEYVKSPFSYHMEENDLYESGE